MFLLNYGSGSTMEYDRVSSFDLWSQDTHKDKAKL